MQHQLSASDVEPLTLHELLGMADSDARARWDALSLGYTESAGLPALREEIAKMYAGVEPAQVLVLSGAEEGIFLAMHALLSPGEHAVAVTPAYSSLHAVARAIGASATLVPLIAETDWQLDPRQVERAVTRHTRVIIINFPHNPTGSHISSDVLRQIVDIAEQAGAVLFSDEVYRGLEYRAEEILPAAMELSATAVSLGVMSKSFALAGLRIGWLATRNAALLDRVARLKDYTTICSSAPSEVLSLIALRARDQILARSRAIISANLGHAQRFFETHGDELRWVPPRAGSVAFAGLAHRNADDVSRQLAEQESTLLIPGRLFGGGPSYFRLGLGRTGLPLALERLGKALRAGA